MDNDALGADQVLFGIHLPDVALTAEVAILFVHSDIFCFFGIHAVTTTATDFTVKKTHPIGIWQRIVILIRFVHCDSPVIHAYRMILHPAPASGFFGRSFIVAGYRNRYVLMAAKACLGFEINLIEGEFQL